MEFFRPALHNAYYNKDSRASACHKINLTVCKRHIWKRLSVSYEISRQKHYIITPKGMMRRNAFGTIFSKKKNRAQSVFQMIALAATAAAYANQCFSLCTMVAAAAVHKTQESNNGVSYSILSGTRRTSFPKGVF